MAGKKRFEGAPHFEEQRTFAGEPNAQTPQKNVRKNSQKE